MHRKRDVVYFALATLLTLFGMVAIFSIGAPLVLTGLVMFLVAPLRRRRALFWGLVSAPLSFTLGYLTVAPLGCTTTSSAGSGAVVAQHTSCSALFGEYHSVPPRAPALMTGLFVATLGGALIARLLAGRERPPPVNPSARRRTSRYRAGSG